jgi:hypothetical protein
MFKICIFIGKDLRDKRVIQFVKKTEVMFSMLRSLALGLLY